MVAIFIIIITLFALVIIGQMAVNRQAERCFYETPFPISPEEALSRLDRIKKETCSLEWEMKLLGTIYIISFVAFAAWTTMQQIAQ